VVKAKRKPIEEIKNAVADYKKVLTIGCGGCVSVCLAGGQREVNALNAELKVAYKLDKTQKEMGSYTVERQCNPQFLVELETKVKDYDCIITMACGAGAQLLAETFSEIPVFPGVNTVSIGIDRDIGMYEEKCRACGECVLAYTGGICPVTRCAKGVFNGPCGGTNKGKCEISQEIPCAWLDIFERLKLQNRLDDIMKMQPPMMWQNQVQRTIVQEPYEKRYYK